MIVGAGKGCMESVEGQFYIDVTAFKSTGHLSLTSWNVQDSVETGDERVCSLPGSLPPLSERGLVLQLWYLCGQYSAHGLNGRGGSGRGRERADYFK